MSGYVPPPWQAPPRRTGGWNDPRFSQAPQHQPQYQYQQPPPPPQTSAQSPISPINPQAFAYHPPDPNQSAGVGSAPGYTNTYDTSTWGVKYNQTQTQPQQWQVAEERPPALPPRPGSAAPNPRPQSAAPTDQWQQNYGTQPSAPSSSQTHQQQPSWSTSYNQQEPYGHAIPPPPPPKPPVYEAQTQQQYQQANLPHEQYSHRPMTHHYDPSNQTNYSQQQYGLHASTSGPLQDAAPVSPIEPDQHKWHQGPGVMQAPATPGESQFHSTALGSYGGPSDWEHFGDGSTVSPTLTSPSQAHAVPVSIAPTIANSPPPMRPTTASPPPIADYNQPPQPTQQDSGSSSVPSTSIRRTDTIDGLINAWNAPLNVGPKTIREDAQRPQSSGSNQEVPRERVIEVVKEVEKVVDPYQDLEPEFRASLKRYAEMLRKEAAADTDEEKFAAFEAFIKKELRLRAMLYGMDSPLQLIKTHEKSTPPVPASVPVEKPPNVEPPAAPVLAPAAPVPAEVNQEQRPDNSVRPATPTTTEKPPTNMPDKGVSSRENPPAGAVTSYVPTVGSMAAMLKDSPVKDESFVMVSADDGEEYSPGGRPRMKKGPEEAYSPGGRPIVKPSNAPNTAKKAVPELSIPTKPPPQPAATSPGANAPMVLEDYIMPGLPSPGANAPMLVEPPTPNPASASANAPTVVENSMSSNASKRSSTTSNKKFEPQRPAYTPFRYSPAVQGPSLPADQSYSSLRKEGEDSGRLLRHDSASGSTTTVSGALGPAAALQPGKRMQDEAFIGLIRQQSKAVRKSPQKPSAIPPPIPQLRLGTPARATTPAANASRTTTPIASLRPGTPAVPNDLQGAVVALRATVPHTVPDSYGLSTHKEVNTIKAKTESIVDQFAFIHQTVVDWDKGNRVVRKQLDEERSHRQADSEARIDDMFNDNEIGYADIGDLEAEFKLSEAKLKYDEDKDELDSFTRDVHGVISSKLQQELSELNAQYTLTIDLLDLKSTPASQCLIKDGDNAEMGIVMNLALSIFNKIELRCQKLTEADVERERRRKRLELTVLYTNGDTQGVKALEAEFAVAEKMQVLYEARARDTRANKLMDAFDRATVRGLGDNQTYVDDMLPKVRRLREMVFRDTFHTQELLYGPDGVRETLAAAQKAIDFVLADSQKLLTLSNVADKLLNDADYSVSVAEARVSNADRATYQKLGEEKEKEDNKIAEDTNSRMSAIGKGPEEAIELIREVVARIGDDPEHQDRIKRALEAAKERNKDGVAEDGS
ncbi:uncharacterized protein HMPREF1541_06500 [Cyphellophora europaea CBS 101466]|uniref:Uncharacterized protein n=1 Tax=Cyphellophora europaea (strain CBS 101466) TaxID=1220924 RepID=W2RQ82_CYPE1|nr:uncharacterized protein HMPREF1541_06500 [Cyphellophora europaea CBS 101466]ETN38465.1 hypothetical protein HMPREF1541_06500 [Cyphellophora europaea CBS 101466]